MTPTFKPGQRVEIYQTPPDAGTVIDAFRSYVLVNWDDGFPTWIAGLALVPAAERHLSREQKLALIAERAKQETKTRRKK